MNWTSIERSGVDGLIIHVQTSTNGATHRAVFTPLDGDLATVSDEIAALIRTVHTPEVIAAAEAEQKVKNEREAKVREEAEIAAKAVAEAEQKKFDDAVAAAMARSTSQ